jgi:hypothetical protein
VDADFEAFIARPPHDVARAPADVGAGEQRAVEQRLDPIVANDRGALNLLEEPRAENPPDRPAGVIGAHAEQKRRSSIVPAQNVEQAQHTLARTAERVDVDFEGK